MWKSKNLLKYFLYLCKLFFKKVYKYFFIKFSNSVIFFIKYFMKIINVMKSTSLNILVTCYLCFIMEYYRMYIYQFFLLNLYLFYKIYYFFVKVLLNFYYFKKVELFIYFICFYSMMLLNLFYSIFIYFFKDIYEFLLLDNYSFWFSYNSYMIFFLMCCFILTGFIYRFMCKKNIYLSFSKNFINYIYNYKLQFFNNDGDNMLLDSLKLKYVISNYINSKSNLGNSFSSLSGTVGVIFELICMFLPFNMTGLMWAIHIEYILNLDLGNYKEKYIRLEFSQWLMKVEESESYLSICNLFLSPLKGPYTKKLKEKIFVYLVLIMSICNYSYLLNIIFNTNKIYLISMINYLKELLSNENYSSVMMKIIKCFLDNGLFLFTFYNMNFLFDDFFYILNKVFINKFMYMYNMDIWNLFFYSYVYNGSLKILNYSDDYFIYLLSFNNIFTTTSGFMDLKKNCSNMWDLKVQQNLSYNDVIFFKSLNIIFFNLYEVLFLMDLKDYKFFNSLMKNDCILILFSDSFCNVIYKIFLTSNDVIHSMGIPSFNVKMDVMPGYSNTMVLQSMCLVSNEIVDLLCTEYCGAYHSYMKGVLIYLEYMEVFLLLKNI